MAAVTPRKFNPRICRGCGLVFIPKTALQRYGLQERKKFGQQFKCRAAPGAALTHPTERSLDL